jgi:hypothetical protein
MVPLTRPGVNTLAGAGGGWARSAAAVRGMVTRRRPGGDPAVTTPGSFGVMVVNGTGCRAVSNGVGCVAVELLSIEDAGEPAYVHAQADRRSCARSRE